MHVYMYYVYVYCTDVIAVGVLVVKTSSTVFLHSIMLYSLFLKTN